jgi:PACS-1 cytosolic sorting protein
MELQVDYWPLMRPAGEVKDKKEAKGQDQGKNSVKSTFRNLQVRIEISEAPTLTLMACSFVLKGMETSPLPANWRALQWHDALLRRQGEEAEK